MFYFKRNQNRHIDFSAVGVDMHSHLIPGVDDGAKDETDSLRLITGLQKLGFKHLFSTPHTSQDVHPNSIKVLKDAYTSLEGKLPEGISLYLSSEYYLDEQFQEHLNRGNLMPLPGNRLLVEFNHIVLPFDLEQIIFELNTKGYHVVLAHPERYFYFHKQFDYYNRLIQMGAELQVNALSLSKYYGSHVQSIAERLVEKDMIDFIGTDVHNIEHINLLAKIPKTKSFARLINSGRLKNQTLITEK